MLIVINVKKWKHLLHAFLDRNNECIRRITPLCDSDGLSSNDTPSVSESPFHVDSDNLSDIELNTNDIPPIKQSSG